jgi:hypothetical protein
MKVTGILMVGTLALPLVAMHGALAATAPKISGRYIVNYVESCAINVASPLKNGHVVSLNTINNGKIGQTTLYAVFTGGNFTFNGTQIQGDAFIDESLGGQPLTESSYSASGTFSNTAGTATAGGTLTLTPTGSSPLSFTVFYGAVSAGIAQQIMATAFKSKDPGGSVPEDCATTLTAIRAGS